MNNRPKKITQHLKYTFSEDEIKVMAYDLARDNRELRALNESKKEVIADFAGKIKGKEGAIDRTSEHIANGYEYRMISCQVEYNHPVPGKKCITRIDTGEYWDEDMDGHEMQEELPLDQTD